MRVALARIVLEDTPKKHHRFGAALEVKERDGALPRTLQTIRIHRQCLGKGVGGVGPALELEVGGAEVVPGGLGVAAAGELRSGAREELPGPFGVAGTQQVAALLEEPLRVGLLRASVLQPKPRANVFPMLPAC